MKQLSDNEHFDLVELRRLGQRVAEWNDDYEYIMTHGDLRRRLAALRCLRSDVLQYAPDIVAGRQYDFTMLLDPLDAPAGSTLPGAGRFRWEDHIMFGYGNETFFMPRAIVCRIFFWSKLNYNLRRLEQRIGYLSDGVTDAVVPEVVPSETAALPHFGLDDRCEGHWADVYHRLCAMGCFDSREVTVGDFRYVCCGKGEPPAAPLVWRGRTNVLAYIVRQHMGHAWATAKACFTLADKPLPASFVNTQAPKSQQLRDKIDEMFRMR